jgi:hypothetical protein
METLWITLEKLVRVFMFVLCIIPGLPFVKRLLVSNSHLDNVPRRGKWSHIIPIYNKWMYLGKLIFLNFFKGLPRDFFFYFFQFLFWKESNTINPRYIGLYLGNFDMGLLALPTKAKGYCVWINYRV